MYKKILLPLDGGQRAECILDIAGTIAARAGAQINLVHVGVAAQAVELGRGIYLEQTAKKLSDKWGIQATFEIVDDERYEPDKQLEIAGALFQYVCDREVDLVILTRQARGGLVRAWLSNVSKHMIHWCPVPVLLWRYVGGMPLPDTISAIQRVVVPLDGSAVSEEILPHAVKISRLLNLRLDLIRVITPAYLHGSGISLEVARIYLDEIHAGLNAQGVPASSNIFLADNVAKAILKCAGDESESKALIAMSTHGWSGIARVLLGSVAEGVLDNATMPLMLYRPTDLSDG